MLFTKAFWKAAGERAIKTFAQAAVAVIGANATGLLDAPWQGALSAGGLAAVLSVLSSIASGGAGSNGPVPRRRDAAARQGVGPWRCPPTTTP